MPKSKKTKPVPFLYYVNDGVFKSNKQMPAIGESFIGWLSASSILRNQERHTKTDVIASKSALKAFLKSLKDDETIKQDDLLAFA